MYPPRVLFGEDRVYLDLTPTLGGRKMVFDKTLGLNMLRLFVSQIVLRVPNNNIPSRVWGGRVSANLTPILGGRKAIYDRPSPQFHVVYCWHRMNLRGKNG